MLLLDIRDHLQLVGTATLTDLARRFDVPESAMKGMMEQWIRKGKVKMIEIPMDCGSGGCAGCSQGNCNENLTKYVWVESV